MSISASRIVNVVPRVINAGASELEIVGLLLTENKLCPFPKTLIFSTASAVGDYFGLDSKEYEMALGYFLGYTNSFKKPRKLVFAKLMTNASSGTYIGTGSVAETSDIINVTKGAFSLKIDGTQKSILSPDLTTATSYSEIATLLNGKLNGCTIEYNSNLKQFVITSNTTGDNSSIEVIADGGIITIVKRYELTAAAITDGYSIEQDGLYQTISSSKVLVATWETVYVDWKSPSSVYKTLFVESTSGELKEYEYQELKGLMVGGTETTPLLALMGLDSGSSWIGSEALTPEANMAAIIDLNQNWVSFTTLNEVSDEIKLGLAKWTNGTNCEYLYCPYTTNVQDTNPLATNNLPAKLKEKNYEGGLLTFGSTKYAIFVMSQGACIDWDRNNGLNTYAFKQQSGLEATVENNTTAENCEQLKVNYYGNFATRNDEFVWYYEGKMYGGTFGFVDAYVGQLWLRNVIQVAIMNGLGQAGRVPYTEEGYALIRSWCQDPINRALKNGAIEPGVDMSEAQKAQIYSEVGADVSGEIYLNGYYLMILDPTPEIRAQRGTPQMGLWYTYGGSVHRVEIPTTVVL